MTPISTPNYGLSIHIAMSCLCDCCVHCFQAKTLICSEWRLPKPDLRKSDDCGFATPKALEHTSPGLALRLPWVTAQDIRNAEVLEQ